MEKERKSQFSVTVTVEKKKSRSRRKKRNESCSFLALKGRQAIEQGAALCGKYTGLIAPRLVVIQRYKIAWGKIENIEDY